MKVNVSDGGKPNPRDVRSYQAPQGPTNIKDRSGPGLHGDVYKSGTQGPTITDCGESGRPGIGGKRHKSGSQG